MNPLKYAVGATLMVDGELSVRRPTLAALYNAIDRMTPSGPAFVIVSRENGDYAQSGGGRGEFSVEWREYGEPFIHLLAGKGTPTTESHTVRMQHGCTKVLLHEVLSIDDVKTLLGAFLLHGRRPEGYLWRDVTDAFIPSAGPFGEITDL